MYHKLSFFYHVIHNIFIYIYPKTRLILHFSQDFLYVYDGSQIIKTITGRITPSTILSYTSNITLQFSSDIRITKRGFEIGIDFVLAGWFSKMHKQRFQVFCLPFNHKLGFKWQKWLVSFHIQSSCLSKRKFHVCKRKMFGPT